MQIHWNMLNKPTYEWIAKVYDHSIDFLKGRLTLNLYSRKRAFKLFDAISTLRQVKFILYFIREDLSQAAILPAA